MAYDIPKTEPTEIIAGYSLKWSKSLADYPADTWTLTYQLFPVAGGAGKITITASADSLDYAISEAQATTADYEPGKYVWFANVNDGTDRHEVGKGYLTILSDPTVQATIDSRSFWRKVLDALEVAKLRLAAQTITSASVNGRSYTAKDAEAMNRDIAFAAEKVRQEDAALALAEGRGNSRKVTVRLRNAL